MNEDFGLNWNDHGWRWYDPAIGRWNAVDPLAEIAPELTPYRFGFNNPILFADLNGLFETREAAEQYAKDNDIYLGWFSRSKIKENKDADGNITYSIDNKKKGTSITDLGGDLGVVTSEVTVTPNDVVDVVWDNPNQGAFDQFLNGPDLNHTEVLRDGSQRRNEATILHAPELPIGPGGAAKGVKTFADIIKGLKANRIKSGVKYVKQGKDQVVEIYKSLRKNGFKLVDRKNGTRVLENAKTGEKLIFRKSKSGGYNQFDSITKPTGGGKNETIFFN